MMLACMRVVTVGVLSFLVSVENASAVDVTANDYGMSGVLQTPTARFYEQGEFALTVSKTSPYTRLNVMLQPFDWLQGGFRYVDVSNRLYGPTIAGNQTYKDKGIDVKFRVVPESRHVPALAVGIQDIGGTGLFAGEYVVANKRYRDLDLGIGLGWGYLGARGDFANPLAWLGSTWDQRTPSAVTTGGNFNTSSYFRGPVSPFASVQYQRPGSRLIVKLEYEGNDYRSEPLSNPQPQTSPVNAALVWRATPYLDLQAGIERGNTAALGVTLHANLARIRPQPRRHDPVPEPVRGTHEPTELDQPATANDLHRWAPVLASQAGLEIDQLSIQGDRDDEVVVQANMLQHRHAEEAADRMTRVLDRRAPDSVRWFTLQQVTRGVPMMEVSVDRDAWRRTQLEPVSEAEQASVMQANPPAFGHVSAADQQYVVPARHGSGGLGIGYQQSLGGPDGFVLYQVSVNASGEYRLTPGTWVSGVSSLRVLDNYDQFTYTGPSLLPRVRTRVREYLTTSRFTVPNAQLTSMVALSPSLYAMGYAGYLESMFAGVGGELLYRPFASSVAVGVDLNHVTQRDFEQDAGLRNYNVLTGHASLYWRTGWQHVLATVKAGRYLAGDMGATLDVGRQFANGVLMGAYATVTDVGTDFGEGGFDKGIYVRVPFDLFMPRATRSMANFTWSPLTRDGGALLQRRYTLHGMTDSRDTTLFRLPPSQP